MSADLDWFVVVEFNQASGQPHDVELVQGRTDADEWRRVRTEQARAFRRGETYRVFALEEVDDAH